MTSSFAHVPYGSIPYTQHHRIPTPTFSNITNRTGPKNNLDMIRSLFPCVQQATLEKILGGTNISIDRSVPGQITINSTALANIIDGTNINIDRSVPGQITINAAGGTSIPDGTCQNDYLRWDNTAMAWITSTSGDVTLGCNSSSVHSSIAFASITIGENSTSSDGLSIAVGRGSSSNLGISVGNLTTSSHNGIAVGTFAKSSNNGVAIGVSANAEGSVSVGDGSNSLSSAIAVGLTSYATATNSIVIGSGSTCNAANSIVIGVSTGNTIPNSFKIRRASVRDISSGTAPINYLVIDTNGEILIGPAAP